MLNTELRRSSRHGRVSKSATRAQETRERLESLQGGRGGTDDGVISSMASFAAEEAAVPSQRRQMRGLRGGDGAQHREVRVPAASGGGIRGEPPRRILVRDAAGTEVLVPLGGARTVGDVHARVRNLLTISAKAATNLLDEFGDKVLPDDAPVRVLYSMKALSLSRPFAYGGQEYEEEDEEDDAGFLVEEDEFGDDGEDKIESVMVFHDVENCPFRAGADCIAVVDRVYHHAVELVSDGEVEMRRLRRSWIMPLPPGGPVSSKYLPDDAMCEDLVRAGVTVQMAGRKRGSVDVALKAAMNAAAEDFARVGDGRATLVVVISGDADFQDEVNRLQQVGCKVVCLHRAGGISRAHRRVFHAVSDQWNRLQGAATPQVDDDAETKSTSSSDSSTRGRCRSTKRGRSTSRCPSEDGECFVPLKSCAVAQYMRVRGMTELQEMLRAGGGDPTEILSIRVIFDKASRQRRLLVPASMERTATAFVRDLVNQRIELDGVSTTEAREAVRGSEADGVVVYIPKQTTSRLCVPSTWTNEQIAEFCALFRSAGASVVQTEGQQIRDGTKTVCISPVSQHLQKAMASVQVRACVDKDVIVSGPSHWSDADWMRICELLGTPLHSVRQRTDGEVSLRAKFSETTTSSLEEALRNRFPTINTLAPTDHSSRLIVTLTSRRGVSEAARQTIRRRLKELQRMETEVLVPSRPVFLVLRKTVKVWSSGASVDVQFVDGGAQHPENKIVLQGPPQETTTAKDNLERELAQIVALELPSSSTNSAQSEFLDVAARQLQRAHRHTIVWLHGNVEKGTRSATVYSLHRDKATAQQMLQALQDELETFAVEDIYLGSLKHVWTQADTDRLRTESGLVQADFAKDGIVTIAGNRSARREATRRVQAARTRQGPTFTRKRQPSQTIIIRSSNSSATITIPSGRGVSSRGVAQGGGSRGSWKH